MGPDVDYLEIPMSTGTNTFTGGATKPPTNATVSAVAAKVGAVAPGAPTNGATQTTTTGSTVRLPTTSQITLTVQPVYSRKNVYDKFSLSSFGQGKLLGGLKNSNDTPGFL